MQSGGYGSGVSEMQRFMVDGGGCPSSLFSISASPPAASPSAAAEIQKFHHPLLPPHPHHLQQPQSPHFAQYCHPIPITQQLFQQPHHHHPFQLFHHHHHHHQQQQQHHLGLEQDQTGQESSSSPGGPQSFLAAMTFKLGVNESSGGGGDGGGGSRDGLNEDEGILHGDDGSESRLHLHHHHHHQRWHGDEESAAAGNIKEPFWRPLDIDFINPNNKRPADDIQSGAAEITSANLKHFKKSGHECHDHLSNQAKTAENAAATDSNYKLFSELEAICKPGGTPGGCGGGGGSGGVNNTNQTGSGSALTGDDNPFMLDADPGPAIQPDNVSDTSNGGDAPLPLPTSKSSSGGQKKRGKKKKKKQLLWIATFFESLVKQLVDQQESLHRKFLEVMERRDQERTNREEAWRKREAARGSREAATRAQERALAASRESAIIGFLEKITGESLALPPKAQFQAQFTEESQKKHDDAEAQNAVEPNNADSANNAQMGISSSRWPKAEVQALIRARSGLETRFQEQGLKGPLWEEVSKEMAAMGYSRSSKRCKEKWENINKYFRKTKDNGKKRPQHSKTCPYFHQLDQLYSTANSRSMQMMSSGSNVHGEAEQRKDNSELLDAIVVLSNEPGKNEDGNEEGQGESQGDDDLRRRLQLCNDGGGFDPVRS